MRRKRKTVRQIAQEAGLELDEALVTLWDAGFDWVEGPDDILGNQELNRARRAFGVATRRELVSATYWMNLLGITPADFAQLLGEMAVDWNPKATRVPPRSVGRLKAFARSKGKLLGAAYQNRYDILYREPERDAPVQKPFEWSTVGKVVHSIRLLREEEVKAFHYALVKDFSTTNDPLDPPGVKSESMLGSAVFRPHTSHGDTRKYETVESAGAALVYSLVNNHPFHNGNKRTAMVALIVFLDENGIMFTCPDDDLFRMMLRIAQHRVVEDWMVHDVDAEVWAIAKWIYDNTRQVEKGERAISWRKLKQTLGTHGCTFDKHGQNKSKIEVSRVVTEAQGVFQRSREIRLKSIVGHWEDGNDVPKAVIKRLREDLRLTEEHNVDSFRFYNQEKPTVEDFIQRYKRTLSRLAKL